jgi:hypothetical protein
MLFVNLHLVLWLAASFAFLLLGIWMFRIVKLKRILIRLPARVVSLGFIGLGSIAILFAGCGALFVSTSMPIYSPDRTRALRIENLDRGALGGDTSVILYSSFGFRQSFIFTGEWKIAEVKDLRWSSNNEVLIGWHGSVLPSTCEDAQGVTVRCERALEPAQ